MRNTENVFIEKDKWFAPFLLAASFNGLIKYEGNFYSNGVLHWKFSPKIKAEELIGELSTKSEPHIPAQDLIQAIDTFWKQISGYKNAEKRNAEKNYGAIN